MTIMTIIIYNMHYISKISGAWMEMNTYLLFLFTNIQDPSILSHQLLFLMSEALSLEMISIENQIQGQSHIHLSVDIYLISNILYSLSLTSIFSLSSFLWLNMIEMSWMIMSIYFHIIIRRFSFIISQDHGLLTMEELSFIEVHHYMLII